MVESLGASRELCELEPKKLSYLQFPYLKNGYDNSCED